MTNEDVFAAAT